MPRPCILVIDDEPGMLRAVERILAADHHVFTCPSPQQAIELADSIRPDLVICDISMPRLDGFEVMEQLKRRRPELDVIMMTGLSDPEPQLIRAIREKAFYFIEKPFNREVMLTLVARALELRRLREAEHRHLARMSSELNEARKFQQTILPPPSARFGKVAIEARYVACSELGGDFYDYADAGSGRVAVVMADVCGHGVSGAMLTSIVKSAFQGSAGVEYQPQAVVRRVAEGIGGFGFSRFITMFCGRIDPQGATLEYINAGHPPAILRPRTGTDMRELEPTSPIVSPAFADETWEPRTVPMPAGTAMLVYTDGVTDVSGEAGPFGHERIMAQLTSGRGTGAELLDGILEAVGLHAAGRPQPDDLTLMLARVDVGSPPA
jgi:sigma-B regulation protein RsbU (phosphoserine phosphatase)